MELKKLNDDELEVTETTVNVVRFDFLENQIEYLEDRKAQLQTQINKVQIMLDKR